MLHLHIWNEKIKKFTTIHKQQVFKMNLKIVLKMNETHLFNNYSILTYVV